MTPWTQVNHNLLAKSLSELHFEEVLTLNCLSSNHFETKLKSGVSYSFQGRMSAWGHVWVEASSLKRSYNGKIETELSAGQFFLDSQLETQMSDITLGTFIEEMNNTLYSDLKSLKNNKTSAELSLLDGEHLQQNLNGHPKLLLNKGRMGWGENDLKAYGPENQNTFKLRWLLAKKEYLTGSMEAHWNLNLAIDESFQGEDLAHLKVKFDTVKSLDDFILLPVHPWQWDQVISLQFRSELESGALIDLGILGDQYSPQVSLRTLWNVDRPHKTDLKLPLTILNTSCVRGLPQNYLTITPKLSERLKTLFTEDNFLKNKNIGLLAERSAWGYQHPLFHKIAGASYRYHEHLGAVWRESLQSKLKDSEQGILTAALFHTDSSGKTLFESYLEKSGLEVRQWLKLYAEHVILPLYHLQLAYGLGLVAHGQNVVVKLHQGKPCGLFLKDFHGDLRLSSSHKKQHAFLGDLTEKLTYLPPEHLIHDLVTGHFITVLRFLAGALEQTEVISEKDFYETLSDVILSYQKLHPELITKETDILAPTFKRVLVNRVRFMIGYADDAQRPKPILGSELKNPLFRAEKI